VLNGGRQAGSFHPPFRSGPAVAKASCIPVRSSRRLLAVIMGGGAVPRNV